MSFHVILLLNCFNLTVIVSHNFTLSLLAHWVFYLDLYRDVHCLGCSISCHQLKNEMEPKIWNLRVTNFSYTQTTAVQFQFIMALVGSLCIYSRKSKLTNFWVRRDDWHLKIIYKVISALSTSGLKQTSPLIGVRTRDSQMLKVSITSFHVFLSWILKQFYLAIV